MSDSAIVKLLKDRARHGVDVRIIGKVGGHAIVRDRRDAFVGSQSLRRLELDNRREAGIIVRNAHIVSELQAIFEEDRALTDSGKKRESKKDEKAEAAEAAGARAEV